MPITLDYETDNICRMEVRGLLRKMDLDRGQEQFLRQSDGRGVRLLVVLQSFEGWEVDANWHDLSFYVRHGHTIERIAIVGPMRWVDETMMFAAADLRRAPVEFFLEDQLEDARKWLAT